MRHHKRPLDRLKRFSYHLVVPTRNPGVFWSKWINAVKRQDLDPSVLVIDSSSNDGSNFSGLPANWRVLLIKPEDFNHGATRNFALEHSPAEIDIIVFMTQDAILCEPSSIRKLVACFADSDVSCAFGRQIPHADASPLAAHARSFNYPRVSSTVELGDRDRLGLKTAFISNSFAAYRLSELLTVGGFPVGVILGEDMSVAARILMAGGKVAYVADACVFHSHNYTCLEEFKRYFDTGVFHARSRWLLDAFGSASGEGLRFVRSELIYLWKRAPSWIPAALLRTGAKWLGYRLGRSEAYLPVWVKRRFSMHRGYWAT